MARMIGRAHESRFSAPSSVPRASLVPPAARSPARDRRACSGPRAADTHFGTTERTQSCINESSDPAPMALRHALYSAWLLAVLVAALLSEKASAVTPVISTSRNYDNACAVNSAGAVFCWGDNGYGQGGIGSPLDSLSPAPVIGLSSGIKGIASGDQHTCAVAISGTVQCWGENYAGQLGNGTTTRSSVPTTVAGLPSQVAAISAGQAHTCALTVSGGVICWGWNAFGQLGNPNPGYLPNFVTSLSSGVTSISIRGNYSCALATARGVLCWGGNYRGQLGNGTTTDSSAPVAVVGLPTGVAAVSAGREHACALSAAGAVYCWGRNDRGQLGDGTTTSSLVAVPVRGLPSSISAISAGDDSTCAITSSNSLVCWGGSLASGPTPAPVAGTSGSTLQVSAGFSHACVITTSQTVQCWGIGGDGRLGTGTGVSSSVPLPVTGLESAVAAVSSGEFHTCALTTGGAVYCWGDNSSGQLGTGRTLGLAVPQPVSGLSSGIVSVSAGGTSACALTADGRVYCWGAIQGSPPASAPVPVSGLPSGVTAISITNADYCVLTSSGGVWCVGGNLGNGNLNAVSPVPVPVSNLPSAIAVSRSVFHTCALTGGGAVYCWGWNFSGPAGNSSAYDAVPTLAQGLSSGVVSITTGFNHNCALKSTGEVLCWGLNFPLVPTPVAGLPPGIVGVSAGTEHTCAVNSAGGVLCWGGNTNGELGSGTTTASTSPVPVTGLSTGVRAISAGHYFTCALTTDGLPLCWGLNDYGEIGDGTYANRTVPVVVHRENGSGSIPTGDWYLNLDLSISRVIPADKTPPFLVTASGGATEAVANVTASAQFRATDIGNLIYAFAYAPISSANVEKDGPTCVLSQLGPSGLQAVSSSNLQSYAGNVTSNLQQTVTILRNVPTTQVAGATFCIGTATTGSQATAAGNSVCVVTVPGSSICLPPAANTPAALSGLWWSSSESGWGIHFTQRGTNVFAAWYTYDTSGNPKWYVSTCAMNGGATGTTGTCSGAFYEVSGPTFFTPPFNTSLVHAVNAGNLQVTFQGADNASMTYSAVASQTRTVGITRQPLSTGAAPTINYTDIWWGGASESGWGMAITQQASTMFLAWYVYDNTGKPIWYVATCTLSGTTCAGSLLRTTGPAFGPTFNSSQVQSFTAGTISLNFTDGNNATLNYTVNGVSGSKTITRQLF